MTDLQSVAAYVDALKRRSVVPFLRDFAPQQGRAHFVLTGLSQYLRETVLDVGCGSNCVVFGEALGDRYVGLDLPTSYKIPNLDESKVNRVQVNFENEPLPFPDQSYSTVLCMDTLEHLDNVYGTYDELFRVARKNVVISLPNNWPRLLGSLLCGHNVSHAGGYGLHPEPKFDGQRHKHFFNLEEAAAFLIGRMPGAFTVREVRLLFERGNDGLLFMPPFPKLLTKIARTPLKTIRESYGIPGVIGVSLGRIALMPLHALSAIVAAAIWGWGSPARYYNLFCRQAWVVFERN